MPETTPHSSLRNPVDRRQPRLLWGLLISLLIHALILSLQIGLVGKGLPSLDVPWKKERGAPVPIQVTLSPQGVERSGQPNQGNPSPATTGNTQPVETIAEQGQANTSRAVANSSAQSKPFNRSESGLQVVATVKPSQIPKKKTSKKIKSETNSKVMTHRLVRKRVLPPDSPRLLTHSGWNGDEFSVPNPPIEVAENKEKKDEETQVDVAASEGIEDEKLLERLKEIQLRKVKSKSVLADAPILTAKSNEADAVIAQELKSAVNQQTQVAIDAIETNRKLEEERIEQEKEMQLAEQVKQIRERRQREVTSPVKSVDAPIQVSVAQDTLLQAQRNLARESERVLQQEEAEQVAQLQKENDQRRAEIKSQSSRRPTTESVTIAAQAVRVQVPEVPNLSLSSQATNQSAKASIEENITKLPPLGQGRGESRGEKPGASGIQGARAEASGALGHGTTSTAPALGGGSPSQGTAGREDVLSQLRAPTEATPQSRPNDIFRSPLMPKQDEKTDMRRRSILGMEEKEVPLRMYIQSWKLKVERNANLNYSKLARDRARGDPVVTVVIRHDGSVDDIIINRSSGNPEIDEAVRRIIKVNAKYAAFPPNVAAQYEVIEIRKVWQFDEVLRIVDELR